MQNITMGTRKDKKKIKLVDKTSKQGLSIARMRLVNETIQALINTPTKVRAAEYLNISEAALYKRLSSYPQIEEGVKQFVENVREDMRRKIVFTTPKAVEKVSSLIDNASSESIQLQASQDILDRAGIVKPSNTNIQVNVLNQLKKDSEEYQ